MDKPSSSLRDLARRLLATSQTASGSRAQEAALVNENLRLSLTRFAGAAGFASLVRRAVALAGEELPALRNATVSADGHLEGLESLARLAGSEGSEAVLAVTAQLLGLLVTFIGEPLMLRLVREAWPETSSDE
ncbi:MAG TPA: hypothetical protein VMV69_04895 [Pirellulales bacterium]|nr:hypothetical protein [Pirellulales bacterium]